MKVQLQHLTISLQLGIIWLLATPTNTSEYGNITNQTYVQRSILRPIVERIFSRRKRFLLLPPGGSIKFTVNVGKRLLAQYPRGFNYAVEAASYYEAFSKRIELIPKFLRKPTTAKPKPKGPTKPLYVYIPGTEIRYKAQPAKKPEKVQRIDADGTALQWVNSHSANKYAEKYSDPNQWIKYTKYGNDTNYQQKYAWKPAAVKHQGEYHYHPKPSAKWTRWTTTTIKPKRRWWQPRAVNESYNQPVNSEDSYTSYTPPSLQHYHGGRDRRQLYQTFEAFSSILGFDMKICIMRAICDCQSLLLPRGYSMVQDMIRAILTIPTHHGIRDEYTDAIDACEQQYLKKCPISLINWFLNPMTKIKI